MRRFRLHHRFLLSSVLLAATAMIVLAALAGTRVTATHAARSTAQTAGALTNAQGNCTRAICTFQLQVNPGLLSGQPFACPAIQHAHARITISDRFVTGAQNDVMILTASGLPKNTGFDLFLVQNSPLDSGFCWFRLWLVPIRCPERLTWPYPGQCPGHLRQRDLHREPG